MIYDDILMELDIVKVVNNWFLIAYDWKQFVE